jgi:hypothetical protein
LVAAGRPAEKLALRLAWVDFPSPQYACLYRKDFIDSERIEIRKMGIVADIDVWDVTEKCAEAFIEVKAQKVRRVGVNPAFFISSGEWRSYHSAGRKGIPYQIWLFQYLDLSHFKSAPHRLGFSVFESLSADWLDPDGYLVSPEPGSWTQYQISI